MESGGGVEAWALWHLGGVGSRAGIGSDRHGSQRLLTSQGQVIDLFLHFRVLCSRTVAPFGCLVLCKVLVVSVFVKSLTFRSLQKPSGRGVTGCCWVV